jgi:ATP-dependent RNA helicase DDX46/PRP5
VPNIDFNVQIVKGPAPDKAPPAQPPATPKPLELGMDVSQLPPQTLAALQRAEAAGRGTNVKENLASAVAKIQATLRNAKAERNAAAGPGEKKAKDPDATDFHAIVPINDYPQKARWKATNKEQMVQLIELSGASITNKGELERAPLRVEQYADPFQCTPGIYYEPGKEPGPGQEPKLHLLIESNEEFRVSPADCIFRRQTSNESSSFRQVKLAVDELRRILLEASVAAIQSESRAPAPTGRYQV